MSMPRTVTITCSKCGTSFETTIFDSINTDFAENLEQSIISGERFSAKCPQCGFMLHLEYDVLYNDMKHNAMIWVVHKENEQYEKRVSEARATPILPGITTRIVNDMNSLREKASCLEQGRDDRVIELCKVVLESLAKEKYPDFEVKNAYYLFENGKEYVCFYDPEEKEVRCDLAQDIYEKMEQLLSSGKAQIQNIPYAIIDSTWAVDFLASVPLPEPEEISSVLKCPNCGNELPGDSEFCQYCGEKIAGVSQDAPVADDEAVVPQTEEAASQQHTNAFLCPNCGKELPVDSGFCQFCGKKLGSDVETEPIMPQLSRVHEADHLSAIVSEKADDHPAELKGKVKHCKRCGGVIDKKTKRCAGCGKQYVQMKVFLPILLLSLAAAASGALNIWQFTINQGAQATLAAKDVTLSKQTGEIDELKKEVAEKDKTIEDKNKKIKEKESTIKEKDNTISRQKTELSAAKAGSEKYEEICDAVRYSKGSYASNHFYASQSVIVLSKNGSDKKFTLTAHWDYGGTVSMTFSNRWIADVDFDNNNWNTSTTMTVSPINVGVTTVTFTNNVDSGIFDVIIIVTD